MLSKLLFALFLVGVSVHAQPPPEEEPLYGTFVGCSSTDFAPSDSVFTVDTYTQAEDCAMGCYYNPGGQYMWAYFQYGSGACMCSNTYYPYYYLVPEPQEYINVLRCADNDYTVWVSASTYSTNRCYSRQEDPEMESSLAYQGQVADPQECFRDCSAYNYASTQLLGDADGAGMNCWCGSQESYLGANGYEAACDFNTFTIYQHPAGTVINSVYAKRQLKERLIRTRNRKRALCPGTLTACVVPGVSDSFECIDTKQELESCGGCMSGEFNEHNSTMGIDCTSLPGVPRGAVTCSNSKCTAFACKKGWTLASDGTCVKA
ncbi:hypothetical protein I302_101104 [Kwoniella bestiolae CBS 10118]|uniref:Protein CPL1-like domain-containing protein n=1 Tax=Kwoniella bestiolae CBS 10118 TaxID=1296100 RepID=A0A1B9G6X6_9TREE|nr:hypothetical protein I302_04479 [Kwoniella bestiolae CBS 10118]OCF26789.1 hypothetical protein I302_04479 [Kwoniella bestiolae CBS 10118]